MYLNYAKIKSGQRKQPMLRLRTLAGKELGPIPYVHDLNFAINYAEVEHDFIYNPVSSKWNAQPPLCRCFKFQGGLYRGVWHLCVDFSQ